MAPRSSIRQQLLEEGDALRLQQEWVAAENYYSAALAKSRSTQAKASAYTRLAALFVDASRDGFFTERLERRPELLPAVAAPSSTTQRRRGIDRAQQPSYYATRRLSHGKPSHSSTCDVSSTSSDQNSRNNNSTISAGSGRHRNSYTSSSSASTSSGGSSSSCSSSSCSSSSGSSSSSGNSSSNSTRSTHSRRNVEDRISERCDSPPSSKTSNENDSVTRENSSCRTYGDSSSNTSGYCTSFLARCSSSSGRGSSTSVGWSNSRSRSSTYSSTPEAILLGRAEAVLLREARKSAAAALRLNPRSFSSLYTAATAAALSHRWRDAAALSAAAARRLKGLSVLCPWKRTNTVARFAPAAAALIATEAAAGAARASQAAAVRQTATAASRAAAAAASTATTAVAYTVPAATRTAAPTAAATSSNTAAAGTTAAAGRIAAAGRKAAADTTAASRTARADGTTVANMITAAITTAAADVSAASNMTATADSIAEANVTPAAATMSAAIAKPERTWITTAVTTAAAGCSTAATLTTGAIGNKRYLATPWNALPERHEEIPPSICSAHSNSGNSATTNSNSSWRSITSTIKEPSSKPEHRSEADINREVRQQDDLDTSIRISSRSNSNRKAITATWLEQSVFNLDYRRRRYPSAAGNVSISLAAVLSSSPSCSGTAAVSTERQRQLLSHLLAALLPAAGDIRRMQHPELAKEEKVSLPEERPHTETQQEQWSFVPRDCDSQHLPLLSRAATGATHSSINDFSYEVTSSPALSSSSSSSSSLAVAADARRPSRNGSYKGRDESQGRLQRHVDAFYNLLRQGGQQQQHELYTRNGCGNTGALSRQALRRYAVLRLLRRSRGLLHIYCELQLLQMRAHLYLRQLLACMHTWRELREILASLMPLSCNSSRSSRSSSRDIISSNDGSSSLKYNSGRGDRCIGGGARERLSSSWRKTEGVECHHNTVKSSCSIKKEVDWDIEQIHMHADLIGGAAGCELLQLFHRKYLRANAKAQQMFSSLHFHTSSSPLSSFTSAPFPRSFLTNFFHPSSCLSAAAVASPCGSPLAAAVANSPSSRTITKSSTANSSLPLRDGATAAAVYSPFTSPTASAYGAPALLFAFNWKMLEELRAALVRELSSLYREEQRLNHCSFSSLFKTTAPPDLASCFAGSADRPQWSGLVTPSSLFSSQSPASAATNGEVTPSMFDPQQKKTTDSEVACTLSEVEASASKQNCTPAAAVAAAATPEKNSSESKQQQYQHVHLNPKQGLQLQQQMQELLSLGKRQHVEQCISKHLEENEEVVKKQLQLLQPLRLDGVWRGWRVETVECSMLATAVPMLQQHCLLAFQRAFACAVQRADWNMAAAAAAWAARCFLHSGCWTEAVAWSTQALELDAWVSADALSPKRPRRLLLRGLSCSSSFPESERHEKEKPSCWSVYTLQREVETLPTPGSVTGGERQERQEPLQEACSVSLEDVPLKKRSAAIGVCTAVAAAGEARKPFAGTEQGKPHTRQPCRPATESVFLQPSAAGGDKRQTAVSEERGVQQQQGCSSVLQEEQHTSSAGELCTVSRQGPNILQAKATAADTGGILKQLPSQTTTEGAVEAKEQQVTYLLSNEGCCLKPSAAKQLQQQLERSQLLEASKQHLQVEHPDRQLSQQQQTSYRRSPGHLQLQERRQAQQHIEAEACSHGGRTRNALPVLSKDGKPQECIQQQLLLTFKAATSRIASMSPAIADAADPFACVSSSKSESFSCASAPSTSASLSCPLLSASTCCYTAVPLLALLTLYSPFHVRGFALLMKGRTEEAAATLRLATLVSLYPSAVGQKRQQQKQQKEHQQAKREEHAYQENNSQQREHRTLDKSQQHVGEDTPLHKQAEENACAGGADNARASAYASAERTGEIRAFQPLQHVASGPLAGAVKSKNGSGRDKSVGSSTKYTSSSHTCLSASVCCHISSELSISDDSSCSPTASSTTDKQSSCVAKSDTTATRCKASSNAAIAGVTISNECNHSGDISHNSNTDASGSHASVVCNGSGNLSIAPGTAATATAEKKKERVNPRQPLRRWTRTEAEMKWLRIKRDRLKIPSF